MQPEGPYRFTHALGGSPVGKAWAAIDEQGRFVTVAVLEATVAATPGWREAFAGAADLLAQSPDPVPYTYADFSAAAPWVAYPAEAGPGAEKLFRALGVDYTPAPMAAPPTSAPPSVSAPPVSAPPQPVSGGPQAPWAVQTGPIPGQLVSAAPHPISGVPASPAAVTSSPPAAHISPVSGPSAGTFVPPVGVPPHDPFSSPAQRIRPSEPRPRRTGLWIGIAALVLVLVGGAGAFALTSFGGRPTLRRAPHPPAWSSLTRRARCRPPHHSSRVWSRHDRGTGPSGRSSVAARRYEYSVPMVWALSSRCQLTGSARPAAAPKGRSSTTAAPRSGKTQRSAAS